MRGGCPASVRGRGRCPRRPPPRPPRAPPRPLPPAAARQEARCSLAVSGKRRTVNLSINFPQRLLLKDWKFIVPPNTL